MYPAISLAGIPTMLRRNSKQVQPTPENVGKDWSLSLPRIDNIKRVKLRLEVDVANGATPGTPNVLKRAGIRYFGEKISVKVGAEEISAHPDLLLLRALWAREGYALEHSVVQTDTGAMPSSEFAVANKTHRMSIELPLDFCLPNFVPDTWGVLPANRCPEAVITGTWGDADDFVDTVGTHEIADALLECEIERFSLNLAGVKHGENAFGMFQLLQKTFSAATSESAMEIEIPGGGTYTRVYMRCTNATGEPLDTVLADNGLISVERGGVVFRETSKENLIARTLAGLPQSQPLRYGQPAFDRTGWFVLDFLKPEVTDVASMTKAIVCPGTSPLTLRVGTAGVSGGKIQVLAEKLIDPPRAAQLRELSSRAANDPM